jgi:predicted nucleotidyltransferase
MRALAFEPELARRLPATAALLAAANLTVHERVSRVVLHGSRGLAGGYRPDSDVDLSLIVEPPPAGVQPGHNALLDEVLDATLRHWRGPVAADLAVVFDTHDCGLKCFDLAAWSDEAQFCTEGGVDCFGLYKTQKGFDGLVVNAGVQVRRMLPCLTIWRRAPG